MSGRYLREQKEEMKTAIPTSTMNEPTAPSKKKRNRKARHSKKARAAKQERHVKHLKEKYGASFRGGGGSGGAKK